LGSGVAKIKVLMVGPAPPQLGGMEAFIGELLKTDLKDKINLNLFDISKPKLTNRRSNQEVVGYDSIFKRKLQLTLLSYSYSLIFFFRYLYHLAMFRPHIVHIHTASYTSFWEKIVYLFIAKALGRKVILHSHGGFFSEFYENSAGFAQYLIRITFNACDMVFVLSESWRTFFKTISPIRSIQIVPNGIHLEPFQNTKIPKTANSSFLFVGRVGKPKGVYELLEAISLAKKGGLDCTVFLMGAGELENVKKVSTQLNIADNVEILGPKYGKEKFEFYSKAWCFVLPSHAEGMPITILEAFAAGLPVISTKVGSIPSVVKEGENGFLFKKQNVEQLHEVLLRIAKDEKLRSAMRENNVFVVSQKYDIKNSAQIIFDNYEKLAKNN
jgi:glycosyltransferase involved in cell wall biosynthesis